MSRFKDCAGERWEAGGSMRVKDILDRKQHGAVTIDANSTVHDAISKMNHHHVGALVVTDWQLPAESEDTTGGHRHIRYSWGGTTASIMQSQAICGLITERDIMVHCGERCRRLEGQVSDSRECRVLVRDAMTKDEDLIIGLPEDDVDYAMRVMSGKGIKHLPILEKGELKGIISLGDIIKTKVEHTEYEAHMLRDYIQGMY